MFQKTWPDNYRGGISHSDLTSGGVEEDVNWSHCSRHGVQCFQMVHSIRVLLSILNETYWEMIVHFNSVHSTWGHKQINVLFLTCWYSSIDCGMGPAVTSPSQTYKRKKTVSFSLWSIGFSPLSRVSLPWPYWRLELDSSLLWGLSCSPKAVY